LEQYLGTLDAVDTEYYAAVNSGKGLTKVIILPLSDSGAAHLGFTVEEFQELKEAIRSYLSGQSTERFGIQLGVFQALPSGRGFLQSPGVYGRR
jgi:hypothetical protein